MQATLISTKTEIANVFADLDQPSDNEA